LISHKVKVIKKIFVSPETGFGVFKVTVDGTRESKIIVGNLFDVKEGDFLDIEGEYTTHQKFGEQIKVSRLTFIQPQDTEGIIKSLSMRIKG
jgi:exodeoxyribonuclease V alpha subunit